MNGGDKRFCVGGVAVGVRSRGIWKGNVERVMEFKKVEGQEARPCPALIREGRTGGRRNGWMARANRVGSPQHVERFWKRKLNSLFLSLHFVFTF